MKLVKSIFCCIKKEKASFFYSMNLGFRLEAVRPCYV